MSTMRQDVDSLVKAWDDYSHMCAVERDHRPDPNDRDDLVAFALWYMGPDLRELERLDDAQVDQPRAASNARIELEEHMADQKAAFAGLLEEIGSTIDLSDANEHASFFDEVDRLLWG